MYIIKVENAKKQLTKLKYPGRDLEAMSFARRYHRWIVEIFQPFLLGKVVEVGAGSGSFSEFLLDAGVKDLVVVEPSSEMFQLLKQNLAEADATIEFHQDFFVNVAPKLKPAPSAIVYVNVMEHIPDDAAELTAVFNTLAPGGHALIFVPALPWLYGSLDKAIDHFRRYELQPLKELCRQTGFEIVRAQYFDFLGILPWWVNFKLLKSTKIDPKAVHLYDQVVVPVEKPLETLVHPPIGKNILIIARKPNAK
jgi:SAM-dependent methyltransferase